MSDAAAVESVLPRSVAAIQQGIADGLHPGLQLFVSLRGRTVADCGFGESRPGVPMTERSVTLWRSAGKPVTAVAILQGYEQDLLSLDDSVTAHIPEFEESSVTIHDLLTHASGLPNPVMTATADWGRTLKELSALRRRPGLEAAYNLQATWYLLGEILRRGDTPRRSFSALIREHVLEPLGMTETWIGMPREVWQQFGDRLAALKSTGSNRQPADDLHTADGCAIPSPGGNTWGPISELGRFYEALGAVLDGDTQGLISAETLSLMTTRHREGREDATFRHVIDLGLGCIVNSNRYGHRTVPYGFGEHCSPDTFGHGGAQCAMGFIDPVHRLVVAWACNGLPGEPRHQVRNRTLNTAIYEDLELTPSETG